MTNNSSFLELCAGPAAEKKVSLLRCQAEKLILHKLKLMPQVI